MMVQVSRYDPDCDAAPYYTTYEVPAQADWTVMDVLDYIAAQLDSTLAYYRHSACDHGVCGRCALRIDGAVSLACTKQVGNAETIVLAPRSGVVVRDLVIKP